MPRYHALFGRRDFTAHVDANPVIFKVRRQSRGKTLTSGKKTGKKKLRPAKIPSKVCCDSVSSALQALTLLGVQTNWINLTDAQGRLVITFQGWLPWLPPKSPLILPITASEPEPERKLAELLESLFKPFELQGSLRYRSRYDVSRDLESADKDMNISLLVILSSDVMGEPDVMQTLIKTLAELGYTPVHVTAAAFEP